MKKRISKGKKKSNKGSPVGKRKKIVLRRTEIKRKPIAPIQQGLIARAQREEKATNYIVRIMGIGQFRISAATVRRLNELDNAIIRIIQNADEQEFRNRLQEMISLVTKEHRPLDVREIAPSDFIIPSTNISIKEAKEWFEGEGLIPEALS